jgi:ATP-binding cassette subfamily F protein 3
MIFVSHDRWFVQRLATRIVEITENGVTDYRGSYDDFLAWSQTTDHLDHQQVLAAEKAKRRAT